MLHISIIYDGACIRCAIREGIFRIHTEVAIHTAIVLVALTLNLILVVETSTVFWTSMRIAHFFAHVIIIDNAFNITILNLISLREALLTLLAVVASVWIGTAARSVLSELWHGVWIAFCNCLLLMLILAFEAKFGILCLPNVLCTFCLLGGTFEVVAASMCRHI